MDVEEWGTSARVRQTAVKRVVPDFNKKKQLATKAARYRAKLTGGVVSKAMSDNAKAALIKSKSVEEMDEGYQNKGYWPLTTSEKLKVREEAAGDLARDPTIDLNDPTAVKKTADASVKEYIEKFRLLRKGLTGDEEDKLKSAITNVSKQMGLILIATEMKRVLDKMIAEIQRSPALVVEQDTTFPELARTVLTPMRPVLLKRQKKLKGVILSYVLSQRDSHMFSSDQLDQIYKTMLTKIREDPTLPEDASRFQRMVLQVSKFYFTKQTDHLRHLVNAVDRANFGGETLRRALLLTYDITVLDIQDNPALLNDYTKLTEVVYQNMLQARAVIPRVNDHGLQGPAGAAAPATLPGNIK